MLVNKTPGIVVLILVSMWPRVSARAGAAPSQGGSLLMAAVRAIRKQEQAVRNIRYRSDYHAYGTNSPEKRLVLSEELSALSIYDGLPRGRYRIEVFHDVSRWTNGPAPFSENVYASAYNGRAATYLETGTGTPKMMAPVALGRIGGRIPRTTTLGLYQETGWNASIFGFTSTVPGDEHPRFSAYINPSQEHIKTKLSMAGGIRYVPTLRATWKRVAGKRYLRVIRGGVFFTDIFWLDPRKGFSITRYESHPWTAVKTGTGIVMEPARWAICRCEVGGFFEPRSGVFFPRSARFRFYAPKAGKVTETARSSISFSRVKVNDPTITHQAYVIAFPLGAVVHDNVTGQVVHIGGTPQQQLKKIENAVSNARRRLPGAQP